MDASNITSRAEESFSPKTIEKELVADLKFPKGDVLFTAQEKEKRNQDLVRATRAGNLEKIKFKIIFEDGDGLKQVYTTIWATTEVNILLKRGVPIPIHRIHSVKIA
jgi:hypothetical protein